MPGASLALFADLGVCHVQKSSVTICVLPAPFRWGATRFKMLGDHAPIIISIHALRVEGDDADDGAVQKAPADFYPRPPGGGRPLSASPSIWKRSAFLSTPSGWRATLYPNRQKYGIQISIHALRVEGDEGKNGDGTEGRNFYPRPPGGGRRTTYIKAKCVRPISIHALRVEGDRGLRRSIRLPPVEFLSTPSGWRATYTSSIEPDDPPNFYPRPPGGGRRGFSFAAAIMSWISIHALRVEGDRRSSVSLLPRPTNFYPRPPGGGRP